jgi:hypothetical protein
MSDKVTPLQPKAEQPSPEQLRVNEAQARLNIAAKVYADRWLRGRVNADKSVDVDLPQMLSNQMLLRIQFDALVNIIIQFGMPADVMLRGMAEAVEKATAEAVRESLARPPAPSAVTMSPIIS